ncbi:hypothetical protein V5O48_015782 [Marasmius crinis-equi]|uniref:DUF6532 domain-containing protein n=1 Tax=Marasmius crinis-equi TaxID=585013 RepID=A0ABR3ETK4_9AGAR
MAAICLIIFVLELKSSPVSFSVREVKPGCVYDLLFTPADQSPWTTTKLPPTFSFQLDQAQFDKGFCFRFGLSSSELNGAIEKNSSEPQEESDTDSMTSVEPLRFPDNIDIEKQKRIIADQYFQGNVKTAAILARNHGIDLEECKARTRVRAANALAFEKVAFVEPPTSRQILCSNHITLAEPYMPSDPETHSPASSLKRKTPDSADHEEENIETHQSDHEQEVVPPRRRKQHQVQTAEEMSVDVPAPTRAPPGRKTKAVAQNNQLWMDPNAGCRKGTGATAENNARKRERALSSAEQANKTKKAKKALESGNGIPSPPQWDDADQDGDILMTDYVPEKKKRASKIQPHSSKTSKTQLRLNNTSSKKTASKSTKTKSKQVEQPPPDEEDSDSSVQGLDVEGSSDSNNGSTSDSEDDDGDLSNTQFVYERASIVKPKSKATSTNSASRLFDDDNVPSSDELSNAAKRRRHPESSPPPPPSEDSGQEEVVVKNSKLSGKSMPKTPMDTPAKKASTERRTVTSTAKVPSSSKTPTRSTGSTRPADGTQSSKHALPTTLKDMESTPKPKSAKAKPSKRLEDHKKEQTVIKVESEDDIEIEDNTQTWSVAATAVRDPNSRKFNLGGQPETLREIIVLARTLVLEFAVFELMYPKYGKPGQFMRNFFLRAAIIVGKRDGVSARVTKEAKEIYERFSKDSVFCRNLANVPMLRFFQFRSSTKSIVEKIVNVHYGLEDGDPDSVEDAKREVRQDLFVFARTKSGSKIPSEPYLHKAIKHVTRTLLMQEKGNGALGVVFEQRFRKLGVDQYDDQISEGAVSIPIVAAVAAAVRVALDEVISLVVARPAFQETIYRRHYEHYVKRLELLRETQPEEFHNIMSKLYAFTRGWEVKNLRDEPSWAFGEEPEEERAQGQVEKATAPEEQAPMMTQADGEDDLGGTDLAVGREVESAPPVPDEVEETEARRKLKGKGKATDQEVVVVDEVEDIENEEDGDEGEDEDEDEDGQEQGAQEEDNEDDEEE